MVFNCRFADEKHNERIGYRYERSIGSADSARRILLFVYGGRSDSISVANSGTDYFYIPSGYFYFGADAYFRTEINYRTDTYRGTTAVDDFKYEDVHIRDVQYDNHD